MQSLTILVFALVGISIASVAVEDIAYEHFASHDANLATFGVDLSPWGYHGGQLPKHYAISGNGSFSYMPTESYTIFQSIISGKQNYTGSVGNEAVVTSQLATRDAGIEKRCETMNFNLYGFVNGNSCTTGFSSSCIDPGACYYGNGCGGWNSITMYYNGNSYITLWTSTSCNGNHGSFNPICNDGNNQGCVFNFLPSSFGTKTDCHSQYGSDGCSSTSS